MAAFLEILCTKFGTLDSIVLTHRREIHTYPQTVGNVLSAFHSVDVRINMTTWNTQWSRKFEDRGQDHKVAEISLYVRWGKKTKTKDNDREVDTRSDPLHRLERDQTMRSDPGETEIPMTVCNFS